MNLFPKQKLTLFTISDWMAHTQKTELEVVSVLPEPQPRHSYVNGPICAWRYGAMKLRGKRKPLYLNIKWEALVFEGWDLPLITDQEVKCDSDGCTGFSGNACFNLSIRHDPGLDPAVDTLERNIAFAQCFIETLCLLPLSDDVKARCVYIPHGSNVHHEDKILLWPDIETAHAVVNRMKGAAA